MTDQIEATRLALSQAISSGEYVEAQQALLLYSRAVSEAAAAMPPRSPEATRLLQDALEFLVWAASTVRTWRQHSSRELAQLQVSSKYLDSGTCRRTLCDGDARAV